MNASHVISNHPFSPGRADDVDLYRRIARELPHGAVFVVDHEMRYIVAQGAELEAAGFAPAHFEGRTVREAVPSSLAEQHEADYRTVLDGGSFEREHEINQRHYRSYGMPLKDEDGRPQLALVVSYDVTGQVLAERRKDKAIAILGHELRNPLATLNMGVALLRRAGSESPPPSAVDLMERQVKQMTRMVDDLLGLAFIAHGRMELRRERCDIADLVDEVLALQASAAAHKRQTLRHVRPAAALTVDADYGKLTQVLTNLLGNAIKYTLEGGAVTVYCRDLGESVAVSIEDTGIGLDPASASRLFDLFSRGEQHGVPATHAEGGLGIGLWVARQLAEAHGGRLDASSPGPGAGSIFTLTIPKLA